MDYDSSSIDSKGRSLGQLVEKACQHWEMRRQAAVRARDQSLPTFHTFTIALSREVGALGTLIAQQVGKQLGWHVYDRELLEQIAQEMSVRGTLLESLDERQQSWITESIEAFLSTPNQSKWEPFVTESAFVRHLVETILALGIHGECVVVGRGAAFILPTQTTLRVRVVAPLKDRVSTFGQMLNLSAKEAARRVRTIDRERVKFIRDHFHKDPTEPQHYDLVLNTGRLTMNAMTDLVIDALCHLKTFAAEKPVEVVQHCS